MRRFAMGDVSVADMAAAREARAMRQQRLLMQRGALVEEGETDANKIVAAMTANIQTEPLARIDYVSAVDGVTMMPVDQIQGTVLVAMAVYIGKTRLIDNFIVEKGA